MAKYENLKLPPIGHFEFKFDKIFRDPSHYWGSIAYKKCVNFEIILADGF